MDRGEGAPLPGQVLVTLTNDRGGARIEFKADEPMTLTADELLALVQGLGHVHRSMIEGHDLPRLEGKHVDLVINTRWAIGSELLGEATVMSFFHPAFGPVGFLVPIDQVDQIARKLQAQVEIARAARQQPN